MIDIGDLVIPVTREWDKKRYTVIDILTSLKTGDRLLQVGYIDSAGKPCSALVEERLFEIYQPQDNDEQAENDLNKIK